MREIMFSWIIPLILSVFIFPIVKCVGNDFSEKIVNEAEEFKKYNVPKLFYEDARLFQEYINTLVSFKKNFNSGIITKSIFNSNCIEKSKKRVVYLTQRIQELQNIMPPEDLKRYHQTVLNAYDQMKKMAECIAKGNDWDKAMPYGDMVGKYTNSALEQWTEYGKAHGFK